MSAVDLSRAREARRLHDTSGHLSDVAMKAGLSGPFKGYNLTARDVDNALAWLGPCSVCTEAKMVAPDQPAVEQEPIQRPGHTIGVDLKELPCPSIGGNQWMVIAGCYASGYPVIVPIKRKVTEMVCQALADVIAAFNQFGNRVERMVFDSERVFYAVKTFLGLRGVLAVYTPAGLHNRWIERLIQTVGAKVRVLEAGMPLKLPAKLKVETYLAAAESIAMSPNSKTGPFTTPFTMVSSLPPVLRPHCHGEVGLCYSKRDDSPDLRAEWCIYLDLQSNAEGHHRVYIPTRGIIYSRRKFVPQRTYPDSWGFEARVTTPKDASVTVLDQEIESDSRALILPTGPILEPLNGLVNDLGPPLPLAVDTPAPVAMPQQPAPTWHPPEPAASPPAVESTASPPPPQLLHRNHPPLDSTTKCAV